MMWACVTGSVVDRKISFAVLGATERSDSLHSSTTSISQTEAAAADGKGHCVALYNLFSFYIFVSLLHSATVLFCT